MTDILYSPWRLKYILSEEDTNCILCMEEDGSRDKDHFVVYRSDLSYIILNMYPYNNGHLMIVPVNHVSSLSDLEEEELSDLFHTLTLAKKVVKKVYKPDGINIGLNLGKSAGAGIDQHIHIHLVPRWTGDVNFMTVISGTRVIPEDFDRAYAHLKEQFDNEKSKK